MNFITARLGEPSTWLGLGTLISQLLTVSASGVPTSQTIVGGLMGLLGILMPEGASSTPSASSGAATASK